MKPIQLFKIMIMYKKDSVSQ